MDARPYYLRSPRLCGAPVTTIDIDFFFRRTPRNVLPDIKSKEAAGRQQGLATLPILHETARQKKAIESASARSDAHGK